MNIDEIIQNEDMLRKREMQMRLNKYFIDEYEIDEEIRVDKRYYIGSYSTTYNNMHILETTVYPDTFFKYSIEDILEYFDELGLVSQNTNPTIDIIQLHILNDEWNTYTVVVKTFWIRLIQRNWRRVFRDRQEVLKRINIPQDSKCLPQLRGLLSSLMK